MNDWDPDKEHGESDQDRFARLAADELEDQRKARMNEDSSIFRRPPALYLKIPVFGVPEGSTIGTQPKTLDGVFEFIPSRRCIGFRQEGGITFVRVKGSRRDESGEREIETLVEPDDILHAIHGEHFLVVTLEAKPRPQSPLPEADGPIDPRRPNPTFRQ